MLEFDKVWFLVQVANFLILLILLNIILFRPLLNLFKEREDRTKGFLDEVKRVDEEKEKILSQINKRLSEAAEEAKRVREELRSQGVEANRKTLELAHREAMELTEKARTDLEVEIKKAKERLKREVGSFAEEIVRKMVGV